MDPESAHRLVLMGTEQLQPGMYVAELDRSWLHSPFPGPGFLVASHGQLASLRELCRYVYVDPTLSRSPVNAPPLTNLAGAPAARALAQARETLDTSLAAVTAIFRSARRQALVDRGAVARAAARIVDQVLRGPEALHWCLRTGERGQLLHRRAVGTAAVAATLGRRLGFDRPTLGALASGALLLDIGKIAVPVPILVKPGALDGAEQGYVRRHVERGLELLAGRETPVRALEMLATHHERVDGSGYPHKLSGTQIPLFGRIAAIADVFDALTLNRHYAAAMTPFAALRQLDAMRDTRLDAALVSELGHALGRYPVGTPVQLADGQIGFVCGQRTHRPLRPHVLVTHDSSREPVAELRFARNDAGGDIGHALPSRAVSLDAARGQAALDDFYGMPA